MKVYQRITMIVLLVIIGTFLYKYIGNKEQLLTEKERDWLSQQGVLMYGADENAPPLRFVDDTDSQYKGVVIDYINQISLELGVEMSTTPLLWETALDKLAKNETQICDMFKSEERSKYYNFTNPIYNLRTMLIMRGSEEIILNDIHTMTIATQKGDYANEYMEKNYPQANLIYVKNVDEALDLLIQGDVDAVVGDEPVITYILNKQSRKASIALTNKILYEEEVVFAVPKTMPELVPILNKAIDRINQKGLLEQIQQKWFGISTPLIKATGSGKISKMIIVPAILILLLILFITMNNLQLKKQVLIRTKELEHSKNELQTIFDGITEYMAVIGKNKNILTINKGFEDYFGIPKEEMIGRHYTIVLKDFFTKENQGQIIETLEGSAYLRSEISLNHEIYEVSTYPLEGETEKAMVSIKNITVDKINKNQILQSTKMIAIGQLAAGMAHEIRNPLGIIRTHSYLIRLSDSVEDSIKKSLDFIDQSVNRASGIIDNLLNFSRISSQKEELVNLRQSLINIIELQNELIKKRDIQVSLIGIEDKWVVMNQESLKHIIMNLTSNAMDAMEQGGNLVLRATIEQGTIRIECEDNGSGIEERNMEKLFNPFFTTKEQGKGTGLGLYIVFAEVEKQNGTIEVVSEVGRGTLFTICIPTGKEVSNERAI